METRFYNIGSNGYHWTVYVYFFGELLGAATFKSYRDADEWAYILGQNRDTHAV